MILSLMRTFVMKSLIHRLKCWHCDYRLRQAIRDIDFYERGRLAAMATADYWAERRDSLDPITLPDNVYQFRRAL